MTSCLKCGRPVSGSGKVAHLLCQRCRAPKKPQPGARSHIVDEVSVARLRCQVTTLCGRNADNVKTAPEKNATCKRCQQLLLVQARNHAYRVALKTVAVFSNEVASGFLGDQLVRDALAQIAEELRLRANGQLQARVIGPEILKRAALRGERR